MSTTTKKTTKKKLTSDETLGELLAGTIDPDEDPLAWAKLVCGRKSSDGDASAGVRNAAIVMIVNIVHNCKNTRDRDVAVERVREALMYAESAIDLPWEES